MYNDTPVQSRLSPRVQPGGSRGGVIPVMIVCHNQFMLLTLVKRDIVKS